MTSAHRQRFLGRVLGVLLCGPPFGLLCLWLLVEHGFAQQPLWRFGLRTNMQGPSATPFVLQPLGLAVLQFGCGLRFASAQFCWLPRGEAANPGPNVGLALGTSKFSGIRGKEEDLVLALAFGR